MATCKESVWGLEGSALGVYDAVTGGAIAGLNLLRTGSPMKDLLICLCAVLIAACGGDESETREDLASEARWAADLLSEGVTVDALETDIPSLPPPGPVVFAVTSDTHIVGNHEHGVTKRLADCFDTVANLAPVVEALFITGDLIDSLETTEKLPHGYLPIFAETVVASAVTVHPVAGNHDYYSQNYPQFLLTDNPGAADEMRRQSLGIEPYYAVMVNGVKFILLNSMQGELWDISLGLSGSLGTAQLQWLEAELQEGAPAVLFLHHPPELTEELDGEVTLADIVSAHNDTVLGVFAGHLHLWSRTELAGVPVYLTAANQDGVAYHHVQVVPETMTLTILNEDEIDYGDFEVSACDPEGKLALDDWSVFAGSVHHLLLESAVAEPSGFGEYLEEAIKGLPLLLHFEAPDPSGKVLPGRLTIGTYVGNGVGSVPPYVDSVVGAPCLIIDLLLDNPCFISQPVNLTMDIAKGFGLPLPAGWNMRVGLTDVQLQGHATPDDDPILTDGLLTMGIDLNLTIADVKQIVVGEYCDGKINGCKPGAEGMPYCPEGPAGPEFFAEIPAICDVKVAGFGLRMILTLIMTVPDGKGSVRALYETWHPEQSSVAQVGGYSPDLFSVAVGGNCAE